MPDKLYQLSFDGTPSDPDLYGDVLELEVDCSVLTASTFSLRVSTVLDDSGSWRHLNDSRFDLFTEVAISVGFGGAGAAGAEPVFDGYVTGSWLHVGSEPGSAYLEVHGSDAMVLLGLEEKAVAWPNLSDSDIAQQIVSGYGMTVNATSTGIVHQDTETLIVQRGSDAQFVRQLAERNGYLFCFQVDSSNPQATCYFGPPQLGAAPQADLAVQFGLNSNLAAFDVQMSGARPLAVDAQQVDPHGKSPNSGSASSTQLTVLGANPLESLVGSKLGQLVTPLQNQAGMLLLPQPTADATELQAVAQSVRDEAGWLTSASGEINSEAYGHVLRPGGLVVVKGVGSLHSGKYFVTRVTHRLKADGSYTQGFEAQRNASDLDGSEQFSSGAGAGSGAAAAMAAV